MSWACHRTGQCCRSVVAVTMTEAERDAVMAIAPPEIETRWEPNAKPGFVNLVAAPCPFVAEEYGKAVCRVHAARPFNCRKFGCFRITADEKLDALVVRVRGETIPVRTIDNREHRRTFARMVTKAERWGRSHGWQG